MGRVMNLLHSKNPFLRKGYALLQRVPRFVARVRAGPSEYRSRPPLLANSVPKSGTHLLSQILAAFPGAVDYGTFWASTPSLTLRERSDRAMARRVAGVVPGELVRAHLFHGPEARRAVRERSIVHFLIYRDPRDVVVSETHYLTHMNRWHRAHGLFRRLATDSERLRLAIEGNTSGSGPAYGSVRERYARYLDWLEEEDVFPVRFEDLVGPRRRETLLAMARFYGERCQGEAPDPERLAAAAAANIRPERSHTFRSGSTGGWASSFQAGHKEAMKEVAGDLLVRLGYEEDRGW